MISNALRKKILIHTREFVVTFWLIDDSPINKVSKTLASLFCTRNACFWLVSASVPISRQHEPQGNLETSVYGKCSVHNLLKVHPVACLNSEWVINFAESRLSKAESNFISAKCYRPIFAGFRGTFWVICVTRELAIFWSNSRDNHANRGTLDSSAVRSEIII